MYFLRVLNNYSNHSANKFTGFIFFRYAGYNSFVFMFLFWPGHGFMVSARAVAGNFWGSLLKCYICNAAISYFSVQVQNFNIKIIDIHLLGAKYKALFLQTFCLLQFENGGILFQISHSVYFLQCFFCVHGEKTICH